MQAKGKFHVKLQSLEPYYTGSEGNQLSRLSLDKTFEGDLSAHSKGEMLSARGKKEDFGGYVAIEQLDGSLAGKKGSFVLQHFGTMAGGQNHLILAVVPDSGTGQLVGLTGTMAINIEAGEHFYQFDYQLPE
jgi:hypothetical protein